MGKRYSSTFSWISIFILLLVCGCAQPPQSSKGTVSKTQTAKDILLKAQTTMKNITSYHSQGDTTIKTTIHSIPSKQLFCSGELKATFDDAYIIKPEKLAVLGSLSTKESQVKFEQRYIGEKIYFKFDTGLGFGIWFSTLENPKTGLVNPLRQTAGSDIIVISLDGDQIEDHGREKIQGQSLYHLSTSLRKEDWKTVFNATEENDQGNNIDFDKSSRVHYWIDESTSHIHRAQILFQMKYSADASLIPVSPSSPKAAFAVVVEYDGTASYDQFNGSFEIEKPKIAIPLSALAQSKVIDEEIIAIAEKADVDLC